MIKWMKIIENPDPTKWGARGCQRVPRFCGGYLRIPKNSGVEEIL